MLKIIYMRHGRTYSVENELIQGSADGEINKLTELGIEDVFYHSRLLADMIIESSITANDIYLLSGEQTRYRETTEILSQILYNYGLMHLGNLLYDDRLSGRSYGELEGKNHKKVLEPKYLISHPKKSISYILASLGFNNASKIEPKSKFDDRVESLLIDILNVFDNPSTVKYVIISGGSDIFKALQKRQSLHNYCYFGNENIDSKTNYNEKIKLTCGDFYMFELGKPVEKTTDRGIKIIPYWEHRLKEKEQKNQKQI